LAEAFEADRILQRQADGIVAELDAAKGKSRAFASPGHVDVDRLLELERYAIQLTSQRKLIIQRQSRIREEIERRRQVLVEADRQVRVLEKVRDKQKDAFQIEQQKREQKEMDEVAGRVAIRPQHS
jgi:flagellar FliJ protein